MGEHAVEILALIDSLATDPDERWDLTRSALDMVAKGDHWPNIQLSLLLRHKLKAHYRKLVEDDRRGG